MADEGVAQRSPKATAKLEKRIKEVEEKVAPPKPAPKE